MAAADAVLLQRRERERGRSMGGRRSELPAWKPARGGACELVLCSATGACLVVRQRQRLYASGHAAAGSLACWLLRGRAGRSSGSRAERSSGTAPKQRAGCRLAARGANIAGAAIAAVLHDGPAEGPTADEASAASGVPGTGPWARGRAGASGGGGGGGGGRPKRGPGQASHMFRLRKWTQTRAVWRAPATLPAPPSHRRFAPLHYTCSAAYARLPPPWRL